MRYFISLGSNLGDRNKNLQKAILFLKQNGIKIRKTSSVYESSPVGPITQPWFFNQVLEVETGLVPQDFLILTQKIEKLCGRQRSVPKGPRSIDIDILLAEDQIVQTKTLIIPHPELNRRNFVLIPLKEISPDTVHPVLKETIKDLWKLSQDVAIVRKIEDK